MNSFEISIFDEVINESFVELTKYREDYPELPSLSKHDILQIVINENVHQFKEWVADLDRVVSANRPTSIIETTKQSLKFLKETGEYIENPETIIRQSTDGFAFLLIQRNYHKALAKCTKPMIEGFIERGEMNPTESPFYRKKFSFRAIMSAHVFYMHIKGKSQEEVEEDLIELGIPNVRKKFTTQIKRVEKGLSSRLLHDVLEYTYKNPRFSTDVSKHVYKLIQKKPS